MGKVSDYLDLPEDYFRGDNVLITGSTSGIGKEAAKAIAKKGGNVYIHGRSDSGSDLAKELREKQYVESKFFKADFSNMNQVRSLADRVKEELDQLDYLINNAGVFMRGEKVAMSKLQYTFVVNHLSHFLLTKELIPLLEESDKSRIVNTSSEAHRKTESLRIPQDFNTRENGWSAYCRSKTCNIMFTNSLIRRLPENIESVCIHPGAIPSSGFFRNLPSFLGKLTKATEFIPLPGVDSKSKGGAMILYATGVKTNKGHYFNDFKPDQPTSLALNKDRQEDLWNYSNHILGLEESIEE
jgi:NAD(P)-dependent dehydrogenase (short-subunit alcohol dehydrogenase family)